MLEWIWTREMSNQLVTCYFYTHVIFFFLILIFKHYLIDIYKIIISFYIAFLIYLIKKNMYFNLSFEYLMYL